MLFRSVYDLCVDNGFLLGGVSGFGVRRTRVLTTSLFGGVVCVCGPGSLFKAPWGVGRRHNREKGGQESKKLLALKVDGGGNGKRKDGPASVIMNGLPPISGFPPPSASSINRS